MSEVESYLRKVGILCEVDISGDFLMERSNIDDSSTGRNTQLAMSRNTRALATSLVEMKIALEDLPMPDVGASQDDDYQQPPGDALDSLNLDPPSFYLRQMREDVHVDSMNVDDLPTGPPADAGDEADSAEEHLLDAKRQVQVHEKAPVTTEGDAQQEHNDPSLGDLPMTEVHEKVHKEAGEGVSQEEQCDPSLGDLPMTDVRPADPMDTGVPNESSNPSPLRVIAVVHFIPPPPTT